MGTLLAWALYPLIRTPLSEFVFLALLASLFVAGVLAADRTGRALGESDHGGIVWDEMVATWLVLLFTPTTLIWQAVAVALFRFFDIVKPPPVRWADRSFKGGFGVMFDDIVAAGYTLLVLAILVTLLGN
jgi:phosphatidylglycerophosphatase A